jgi:hypothetical protein
LNLNRLNLFVAIAVIGLAAVMLFARLGRYSLWDDEAITALTAKGVWQTGDTSAVVGHNLVAFRNGLLLDNLKDRSSPPLQFYVSAPFIGIMGDSALSARLVFAISGLACVGLMFWWLHRARAPTIAWVLLGMAVIGNVSFFLFARQARYYGLAMLLGVAVAYSYLHIQSRRGLWVHALLSILLLAANYMVFAAVSAMLVVDYALWGRRRFRLSGRSWAILLFPQIVAACLLLWVWNPMRIAEPRPKFSWIQWHGTLLWWHVRELSLCEFACGGLLVGAPLVAWFARSLSLLRALIALVVAILVITLITPQNPSDSPRADVRYLSFLIPLCIAIAVMTILPLARWSRMAAIAVAAVAFGSNLLSFAWLSGQPVQSTLFQYARELIYPVPEPYTPTADWIRRNVAAGQTILVLPDYMMYPLMYHAPNGLYAWQLSYPPPEGLRNVNPIHFRMVLPTEYIVAFGPMVQRVPELVMDNYEEVARIDVFWRDVYRPELFWRSFTAPPGFDRRTQAIYIFRRVAPTPSFRF